MSNSTTTGFPMVCLVDVDGFRIGVGEKDIPQVDRELCEADRWGRWTDVWQLELGPERPSKFRASLVDLLEAIWSFASCQPIDPADLDPDVRELAERTGCEVVDVEDGTIEFEPPPIAGGSPDPDRWHDAPDASPHARFPGARTLAERMDLPPLCGGGPEPDEADWQSYREWSEALEMRRWYDAHPIADHLGDREGA